ncbi:hypothetical protein Hypma_011251 [Hypsizygus marmoreus]|uniref:Uncharacterized protein n=1 Tax=Hypsizygus marmoreus TaxID=39966 RepID=A0A369JPR1_HYPMA|nr:hypothetical protein Hypma_011251 [Hypsizygus marmoreus]
MLKPLPIDTRYLLPRSSERNARYKTPPSHILTPQKQLLRSRLEKPKTRQNIMRPTTVFGQIALFCAPVVFAQSYDDEHFYKRDLSIADVAFNAHDMLDALHSAIERRKGVDKVVSSCASQTPTCVSTLETPDVDSRGGCRKRVMGHLKVATFAHLGTVTTRRRIVFTRVAKLAQRDTMHTKVKLFDVADDSKENRSSSMSTTSPPHVLPSLPTQTSSRHISTRSPLPSPSVKPSIAANNGILTVNYRRPSQPANLEPLQTMVLDTELSLLAVS